MAVLAIGVVIAVALAWAGDDDVTSSGTTTSSSSSTTSTSTTLSTTTSTTMSTTTTVSTPTPTPPPAVSVVSARPGGGSGEVALAWDTVPGATGYRVMRSTTVGGPFSVAATIDVTSGVATAGDEVVNIWSDSHSYIPSDGRLTSPDPSSHLEYVEVGGAGQRCFQVVAYNGGGDAQPSVVACAP